MKKGFLIGLLLVCNCLLQAHATEMSGKHKEYSGHVAQWAAASSNKSVASFNNAQVYFQVQVDVCILREVYLSSEEGVSNGLAFADAALEIYESDSCTGDSGNTYGFADIDPGNLIITGVDAATLNITNMTVTMYGGTVPVDVNLSAALIFTSSSDTNYYKRVTKNWNSTSSSTSKSNGRYRNGSVTGSVDVDSNHYDMDDSSEGSVESGSRVYKN